MVVESITRGGAWGAICFGYGRILKARHAFSSLAPESMKRALLANPEADMKEVVRNIGADEILAYNERLAREVIPIVLHEAHDWDKQKMSAVEYLDTSMPEDVGREIVRRMSNAIEEIAVPDESKKN